MDEEQDFKQIAEMIRNSGGLGLGLDQYCKEIGMGQLVGRYKLNRFYQQGRLCLDSSLGGLRYFLNDIVTIEFK